MDERENKVRVVIFLVVGLCACAAHRVSAQRIAPLRTFETAGTIKAIVDGAIAITDKTGKSWKMKIRSREDAAVSLGGARIVVPIPAIIKVSGELGLDALAKDVPIRFVVKLNRDGKMKGVVTSVSWIDEKEFSPGIRTAKKSTPRGDYQDCTVTGDVEGIRQARRGQLADEIDLGPQQLRRGAPWRQHLDADGEVAVHDLAREAAVVAFGVWLRHRSAELRAG